ncbi:class A beta-lactamase-related serine hydrolase [Mycolicibacterium sp. CH28]|uniref:serine hydrolase domain-containing protein n=1 Tax=Mycolicibacterium sp. CH28 TaxID=2512237 RepID=UPI001080FA36|nr:serine hydrolase domain-containing protein [Mycolicibacterium sp. CH28]TGD84290.1 class A beta-lactamase-related serine hydrolase [Mycolicibacterium sp. CH28]
MTESARATVAAIVEHWAVPGGAVLAVDKHRELFSYRFGHADVSAGIPVAAHHLFEIGSISKVFNAIAILQLARRGLIRLDDPISAVLEWLPEPLHADGITIERLLTHTAGLVASTEALPDELGQVAAFTGAVSSAAPGTFFHYSNLGFLLLGQAARQVSGQGLPELVREQILAPLQMNSTITCVTHDDYSSLARGYQSLRDDRPWTPGEALVQAPWLEVAGSDGNIAATVSDLAIFARMLLGRGTLGQTTILHPIEFDTMIGSTAPDGEDILPLPGVPPTETSRYGLGVNVERAGGHTVLSHGGGMVGYASFLLADLDDELAVCVVTNANGDSPIAEAVARSVAAELRSPGSVDTVGLTPQWWPEAVEQQGYVGEFVDESPDSAGLEGPRSIRVTVEERSRDRVRLALEWADEREPLQRTWTRGAVVRARSLAKYSLTYGDNSWRWGPRTFTRAGTPVPADPSGAELESFCGHYRSYSPWYTNFRVVSRRSQLFLIAPGGVEAPTDDSELIALGERTFRVGADPRLPERITFGPPVNGMSAWAIRDGCQYSRSFTD